jgi:GT2 family glycosyltransferase/glycosyltransferase involved in cell wall biosynthesis
MNKPTGVVAPFSDRTRLHRVVETNSPPAALVVLGMHRSGTSALTRVLSLSGYALPSTLMEAAPDNEEGFWESRPISELNDVLLKQTGSYWDDPFAFSPTKTSLNVLSSHHEQAVELIRSEFPEAGPLVLKDPRITILYDFWRQALQAVGYEAAPIICVRHPLEVAASLAKRNKFPTNKSLLIWLSYQLAAERATRDMNRAFVMYDDLMTDWRACLDQLERSLGLTLERRDPEAEVLIERFLRPDLRHHTASEERNSARRSLPSWVLEAYEWFKAAAREGRPETTGLNAAVAEYSRQRKWFGPLVADLRLHATEAASKAARDVQAVEKRLLDADAAYRGEIAHRDDQLEALQNVRARDVSDLEQQIVDLDRIRAAQLAAMEEELDRRRARVAELEGDLRSERAAAVEAGRKFGAADAAGLQRIAELERQVLDVNKVYQAQLAERDEELRRQNAAIARGDAELKDAAAAYQAQLAARDGELQRQNAALTRLDAELKDANRTYQAQLAARDEELQRQNATLTQLDAELKDANRTYQAQLAARDDELQRQNGALARLDAELKDAHRAHQAQLAARDEELQRQNTALARLDAELKDAHRTHQEHLRAYQGHTASRDAEARRLTAALEQAETQARMVQAAAAESEAASARRAAELESRLRESERAQVEAERVQLSQLAERNQEIELQKARLDQLVQLHRDGQAAIAAAEQRLRAADGASSMRISELERQVLETNRIYRAQIETRESEMRRQAGLLAALDADLQNSQAALAQAGQRVAETEQRIRESEADFTEKAARLEAQLAEADKARDDLAAERDVELQRQNARSERMEAERREALEKLVAAEQRRRDFESASASRISELEAQNKEINRVYQGQVAALQGQVQHANRLLKERAADLQAELDRRQARFVSVDADRVRAEVRIDALTRAHEIELERRDAEDERLRTERDEIAAAAAAQTERADVLAADLGRLGEKNRTLRAALCAANAKTGALEQQLSAATESEQGVIGRLAAVEASALAESEAAKGLIAAGAQNHHAEISRITRAFEAERARRDDEIRTEVQHAQDVITALQSDLFRAQMVARERAQQLDRAIKEKNEITSSTLWRLAAPVRWFGRKAPFLSKGSRGLRSAVAAVVRPSRKPETALEAQAVPQTGAAPTAVTVAAVTVVAAATSAPTAPPIASGGGKVINPEPIALYLTAENGESEPATAWRQHCLRFPLPIDPDSAEKPKIGLSDQEASEWIRQCADAGSHLQPVRGAPDVSIIIPVYNQLAFTLSAIASVYALKSRYSYEILVADDGSSDQTRLLTDSSLPRVRMVRHPKNLGFLLNCNVAAEQAKGGYIVLLNNDTVVLPGWLDELIGTLKDDPQAGMVGSKLLYANGTLQEAGGIVWQDGSAWNWGRNQDPRDPRYCYTREADYCSGASIAISADLWRQLGGFDGTWYENSYYEDVDLAFRVREAGRKVLYQPLSAIVHFEGISSGVDVTVKTGAKKYQVINGERFFERWRETLKSHRPNGVEPISECERSVRGRLLIIDAVTPTPEHDAGSLVMMEMIKSFRDSGWRTSFVPEDNFAHLPVITSRLQRHGIEALYWPHFQSVDEILEKRGEEYDVVLISRVGPASKHFETVRRRAPKAKIIFNTVDLHYLREQREAALSQDPDAVKRAEKTRTSELSIVASSDLTIVHSTVERDILGREAAGANVTVFPWISDVRRSAAPLSDRESILFVGGFRHAPNVDGLRWFLQNVWPRVRAQAPGAMLKVIGADAPPEFDSYNGVDGVTMMGWVQNLDAQLDRARLSVAPLRYGAGVKGKVVSALSTGVPVVCTTIASEGMGLCSGREVVVANDPDEFAYAVVRLLNDDEAWAFLSENGLRFVDENYSRNAALKRVKEMIRIVGLSR